MNMGKLGHALVWCLLAALFPLAANAVPKIELTAYVEDVKNDKKNGYIDILVVEGDAPWRVHIRKFTDVGIDLKNSKGTLVAIKGVYAKAEGGIFALEIEVGVPEESKIEGTITGVGTDDYGRYIIIAGHRIPVPAGTELLYESGRTIADEHLSGLSVKVEGDTVGEYFYVNAVKQINPFYCGINATHWRDPAVSLSADIPSTEVTTEWCQLENGKRTGYTEISEFIYPILIDDPTLSKSNYTFGKWKDGKRDGYWLTIDVAGKILRYCRYKRGDLNKRDSEDSDSSRCPE
jgi:hypothetical protein